MSAFGQTGHRADMAPRPVLTLRSPEGEPQPEGPKQGLDVVSALLRWGSAWSEDDAAPALWRYRPATSNIVLGSLNPP
jgi:hypothetical protein